MGRLDTLPKNYPVPATPERATAARGGVHWGGEAWARGGDGTGRARATSRALSRTSCAAQQRQSEGGCAPRFDAQNVRLWLCSACL